MNIFKLDTAVPLFTSSILVLQFTNILVFQFLEHPQINQVCWQTHQSPSAIEMSIILTPNIFLYFTCQRCPQRWIPMSICSSHGSVHYLHVHNVENPASPYLTSLVCPRHTCPQVGVMFGQVTTGSLPVVTWPKMSSTERYLEWNFVQIWSRLGRGKLRYHSKIVFSVVKFISTFNLDIKSEFLYIHQQHFKEFRNFMN